MHGYKRSDHRARLANPKVCKALEQKAQQWHALSQELNELRTGISSSEQEQKQEQSSSSSSSIERQFELTDTLLRVNPDPSTLWNIRRDLILCRLEEQEQEQLQRHQQQQQQQNKETRMVMLQTELQLTQASLGKNPKAYGAWFHRKWCIRTFITTEHKKEILEQELVLTEQFLTIDQRNFHCWNYRRYIIGLSMSLASSSSSNNLDGSWDLCLLFDKDDATTNINTNTGSRSICRMLNNGIVIGPQLTPAETKQPQIQTQPHDDIRHADESQDNHDYLSVRQILQQEWEFSHTKIHENFSNFSAFHYRSKLLPIILSQQQEKSSSLSSSSSGIINLQTVMNDEWELMENIIFTEPDDQTVWWYHRFILDFVWLYIQDHHNSSAANKDREQEEKTKSNLMSWYIEEFLQPQADSLRELYEEDGEACKSKWLLLGLHLVLSRLSKHDDSNNSNTSENNESQQQEMIQLLNQLIRIDPDRKQRYKSLIQKASD